MGLNSQGRDKLYRLHSETEITSEGGPRTPSLQGDAAAENFRSLWRLHTVGEAAWLGCVCLVSALLYSTSKEFA